MEDIDKLKLIERIENQVSGSMFCRWERMPDGKRSVLFISRNIYKYLKISEKDIMTNPCILLDNVLARYIPGLKEQEELSYHTFGILDYELEYQTPLGQLIWLHLRAIPDKGANCNVVWSGIITDITKRKKEEYRQQKINHEFRMFSMVNDLILNSSMESALFDKVCNSLVNFGGYELVWFSGKVHLSEENFIIHPVSYAGNIDYLNEMLMDIEREKYMKGPTVMAYNSGRPVTTNDIENSEDFGAWRCTTRKHKVASSLVIPFMVGDENYTMNIYSNKTRTFDDHEVSVFKRMLKNIVTAVAGIRGRMGIKTQWEQD